MRSTVNYLGLACTGALLLACASGERQAVAPEARPSQATADSLYLRGRSEHQAHRLDAARSAYLQALQLAPGHVSAANGLAVLHAAQGDYPQAIALWRALGGIAGSSPESAFLYRNLGYAYFRSGELEPALAALEKACLLDPLNLLAWRHLGEVLEKLGQGERAARTAPQSSCRPAVLRLILGRELSDAGALRRRYVKSAAADKLG
jgi:Flp pilus assembly protein TadD